MPPFIHLLERGTLSNLFLKSKVNVLTAKLKTCFGSAWGSEGRVLRGGRLSCHGGGEEEEDEEQGQEGNAADEAFQPLLTSRILNFN